MSSFSCLLVTIDYFKSSVDLLFQHSASLSIFLSKSEIELNLNLVGNKLNPLFIGFIFRALMELSGYVILILIKTTM